MAIENDTMQQNMHLNLINERSFDGEIHLNEGSMLNTHISMYE